MQSGVAAFAPVPTPPPAEAPRFVNTLELVRGGASFDRLTLQDYAIRNLRGLILKNGGAMRFTDFCKYFDDLETYEVRRVLRNSSAFRLDGDSVSLRVRGGWIAEGDICGIRPNTRDGIGSTLLRAIPHITHNLMSYYQWGRFSESPPRITRRTCSDSDITFLQTAYDTVFPQHRFQYYEHDQLCVEGSDLVLGVDHITVEPGRSFMREKKYDTLRPRLATMMPSRRVNSQREGLLGAIKRNLNAPVLADTRTTAQFIGECTAKNFIKSVVDPTKVWMMDSFLHDPIDLSPAMVDRWLASQTSNTAAAADTGLGL